MNFMRFLTTIFAIFAFFGTTACQTSPEMQRIYTEDMPKIGGRPTITGQTTPVITNQKSNRPVFTQAVPPGQPNVIGKASGYYNPPSVHATQHELHTNAVFNGSPVLTGATTANLQTIAPPPNMTPYEAMQWNRETMRQQESLSRQQMRWQQLAQRQQQQNHREALQRAQQQQREIEQTTRTVQRFIYTFDRVLR